MTTRRQIDIARKLRQAAESYDDPDVAAENEILAALTPHLDKAGHHNEDGLPPPPQKRRGNKTKAVKQLAAEPAPKIVIQILTK